VSGWVKESGWKLLKPLYSIRYANGTDPIANATDKLAIGDRQLEMK
jgi:hypothetical protein